MSMIEKKDLCASIGCLFPEDENDDEVIQDGQMWRHEDNWYAKRWHYFRATHMLARPGTIRDIKWRLCSLVIQKEVDLPKFQALCVGLLGLGDLKKGTTQVGAVLTTLFESMRYEDGKGFVDIREFVGALIILEFGGLYANQPEKVIQLLFETMDNEGTGWLVRRDVLRLCLLLAGTGSKVSIAKELARSIYGTYASRIRSDAIILAVRDNPQVWTELLRSCLPSDVRLTLNYQDQMKQVSASCLNMKKSELRSCLNKWISWRLRVIVTCWRDYARDCIITRVSVNYATRWLRIKKLDDAMRKLFRWKALKKTSLARCGQANKFYNGMLLERTFTGLKEYHKFHLIHKEQVRQELEKRYTRGFEHLEKAHNVHMVKARLEHLEYAFSWLSFILKKTLRNEELAFRHWHNAVLRKLWGPWATQAKQRVSTKHREEAASEAQGELNWIMRSTVFQKQVEDSRVAESIKEAEKQQRLNMKYQASFFEAQETIRLEKRKETILQIQQQEQHERVAQERKERVDQIQGIREEFEAEIRADAEIEVENCEREQKKRAKAIRKCINSAARHKVPAALSELVQLFGGENDSDRCPPEPDTRLRLVKFFDSQYELNSFQLMSHSQPQDSWQDALAKLGADPPKVLSAKLIQEHCVYWQMVDRAFRKRLPEVDAKVQAFQIHSEKTWASQRIQRAWRGKRAYMKLLSAIADAQQRRRLFAAQTLQRYWRRERAWKQFLAALTENYVERIEPYSGTHYFLNLSTGTSTWTPPKILQKRGLTIKGVVDKFERRPWDLRYTGEGRVYYENRETGVQLSCAPAEFASCTRCHVEFADRLCLSCREVHQGTLVEPLLCAPCWISQGHIGHDFENTY